MTSFNRNSDCLLLEYYPMISEMTCDTYRFFQFFLLLPHVANVIESSNVQNDSSTVEAKPAKSKEWVRWVISAHKTTGKYCVVKTRDVISFLTSIQNFAFIHVPTYHFLYSVKVYFSLSVFSNPSSNTSAIYVLKVICC